MQQQLIESKCVCIRSYHTDTQSSTVVFEEGEYYTYYKSIDELLLDPNSDCGLVRLSHDNFKYRFMDVIEYRNIQLDELIN
jgi:hypothetical protein